MNKTDDAKQAGRRREKFDELQEAKGEIRAAPDEEHRKAILSKFREGAERSPNRARPEHLQAMWTLPHWKNYGRDAERTRTAANTFDSTMWPANEDR
jgi:hypothetical protein